ncbi:MAG: type 1 glutamine amidotransferase [Sulfolobus sp.]
MEKLLVIQNHEVEKLGKIEDYLKGLYNIEVKFAEELKGNEIFDALIVLGGPQGVYERDKYKYLDLEIDLIKKSIASNKRILGISLGAQLLSHSAGGQVAKGTFGPEFGILNVKTIGKLREIIGKDEIHVLLWHRDTFTVPPNGELLGYTNKYFQAFKLGRSLGLQFHLEIDEKEIEDWFNAYTIVDSDIISSSSVNKQYIKDKFKELYMEFYNNLEKIIKYWLSL